MDGENNGSKPYEQMDDLGVYTLFLETPIYTNESWQVTQIPETWTVMDIILNHHHLEFQKDPAIAKVAMTILLRNLEVFQIAPLPIMKGFHRYPQASYIVPFHSHQLS